METTWIVKFLIFITVSAEDYTTVYQNSLILLRDTILSANLDNSIYWFHSVDPAILAGNNRNLLRTSIFSKYHPETINLNYSSDCKYTKPNNIIFTIVDKDSWKRLYGFYLLGLSPSAQFILFVKCINVATNNCNPIIPNILKKLPAIKLVVFPLGFLNTKRLAGLILSNNYFNQGIENLFRIVQRGIFKNPLQFHKSNFLNGNRVKVPAKIHVTWIYFYELFGNNRHLCSVVVANAKYYMYSHYCSYDVLTTLYLADVHNMTIPLLNIFDPNEGGGVDLTLNSEFIGPSSFEARENRLFPHQHTGLSFSNDVAKQSIYCLKRKPQSKIAFDYEIWAAPFSYKLWILTFVALTIAYVILLRNMNPAIGIPTVIALCSNQGFQVKSCNIKFYVVMIFPAFFLGSFYGNEITSLMVSPPGWVGYQSLKQILEDGYKIIFQNSTEYKTDIYDETFKRMGLHSKMNNSFRFVSDFANAQSNANYLTNHSEKNILIEDTDAVLYSKFLIEEKLVNQNVSCHIIPEKVVPSSLFRIFYTVNRYWMMINVQRMKDAGLDVKWERDTKTYHFQTEQRFLHRKGGHAGGMDLIVFPKFIPILTVYLGSCVVSAFILLIEKLQFR
ncbi:unnamed protein product [Orchesella dallaii]|uniref:Uncharacterized protein n=1 Tax=Orchesella dallaii TaxID=48710 RepID=A0ABP1R4Q3_9HEXA